MSKGNTFENDLLKLIFNGTPIPNIADNAASSPLTELWLALHTADPGEGGDQTTNECAYTSYARVSVERSDQGWTVTGNQVSPNSVVNYPSVTGGSETATHASVGVAQNGASKVLYKGTITPNITITTGVTPQLTPDSVISED